MVWGATGLWSPTLVLGKVMEEIILSAMTWHMQDNWGFRPSQHRFMKGRSYLTNLSSFYNKVIHLVEEGCVCSLSRLQWSIWHCLPEHTPRKTICSQVGWVGSLAGKKWIDGRTQRLGVKSSCYLCSPGLSFGLVLLNIFIDDLDLGIEGTLS